ncbi:MAG: hypothetical protein AAF560_28195 [Acidobacteriota bacterium]
MDQPDGGHGRDKPILGSPMALDQCGADPEPDSCRDRGQAGGAATYDDQLVDAPGLGVDRPAASPPPSAPVVAEAASAARRACPGGLLRLGIAR